MKTFVALLLAAASLAAVDYTAEGDLWWAHIKFLADDKLQGRNTGSEGYTQAVQYVAGRFESLPQARCRRVVRAAGEIRNPDPG